MCWKRERGDFKVLLWLNTEKQTFSFSKLLRDLGCWFQNLSFQSLGQKIKLLKSTQEKSRFILLNVCREDMWALKGLISGHTPTVQLSQNYKELSWSKKLLLSKIYTQKEKAMVWGLMECFYLGGNVLLCGRLNWELLFID